MFRLSAHADPAFLAEMLYEAVNWRDDGAEERPPLDEVLARSRDRALRRRTGAGNGDVAIVALDRRDEPVGAAWYRRFTAAEPGYGYVADDIPELAIARVSRVPRPARRQLAARLGRRAGPERDGDRAISLSVTARTRPGACTRGTASRSWPSTATR